MENLSIDNTQYFTTDIATDEQLLSASKWARFIGVVYMIFSVIFVLIAIFLVVNFDAITDELMKISGISNEAIDMLEKFGKTGIPSVMIFAGIIVFIIGLFLFRFGARGCGYVKNKQESELVNSLANLKLYLLISYILGIISAVISLLGTVAFFNIGH